MDALARTRLRPLQYPRERDRARLDHDRAPARKMADAGKRGRATAPPMPEAEAHAGRDSEIHGLPCIRGSIGLHRAALRGGRWLGVNAVDHVLRHDLGLGAAPS